MLWWVSWKAWIVSSSPAKRRFSKTLPAWRRSAMPSAMCSRKRWGCGWWMVLFAKTHLSQIVLLRMNCALKAFHFFFSCCFLCLLRPRVRTAVVMKLMMKTNRCCKSNSKLDQHNAEFLLWKYLSWSKSFSVFCGPLLNTMQSKVTIRVCEVFISFSLRIDYSCWCAVCFRQSMMPCSRSLQGRESPWWPPPFLQTTFSPSSMTCCPSSWTKLWVRMHWYI